MSPDLPITRYHLIAVLWLACSAAYSTEQPVLSLQAATELAVQDNPGLAQINARAQAMAAIPSQVGTLPDPAISFSSLNLPTDTFDTRQEPMTQMQFGVSQSIPFPGKLALNEQAAGFAAEAAAHDVIEARWRLLRDVKKIWWSLFYLDRALEIIKANQDLLRQFVAIAQTKYQVGEGLQQDVLLAQLELSRLLDNELVLVGTRERAKAQLNALLDRPADQQIALPKAVSETLPNLMAESALFEQAENARALLASRRESVNVAQTRLELAKKDYFPDFNVGASYGIRDNTLANADRADFLSMKLSMTVPIFLDSRQAKAVDQRTSELMQQRYELQDEWNRVRADISTAYSDFHQTKNQVVLFKSGIIPQARQTVASMLAGYQVGKVDFLNLVRSQITLYNYETQYWKALSEANQALAQLSAMVGKEEIYE
ncbi:TolC family protein [Methylicorpusculum oleiharenae]|uniref:TolC family protein n=1 Tax=Methylicorpusculum oleiharenae TaxID=1338687 RepID=UPI00135CDB55|nr:TolC family protein [Methylicorpusculum oleiharenae]MCD2453376.1 TolC family protein [Methylicorpusculum oleiharenae]